MSRSSEPETWRIAKPAKTGQGGIVASQHRLASAAGAEILEAGGNAVDAAVAAAFALGVVEPWMSGLAGVGFLVAGQRGGKVSVVDFGPQASAALDPARYPLDPAGGRSAGMFGWPLVEGRRNERGGEAVLLPLAADGFGLAVEAFGRKSLAEVMAPALRLVERGLPLDWAAGLQIAAAAADLREDPQAAAVYLPGGLPAMPPADGARRFLDLGSLGATYRRLAQAGRRDFYEGALARDLAADLAEAGSPIGAAELAGARARITEPFVHVHRDARLHFAERRSGASAVVAALEEIARRIPAIALGYPDGEVFVAYAEALRAAFRARLAEPAADGCTTHVSAVDREGNMAALTVTLGSAFGARILLPRTGLLPNNGVYWFDPVPGRADSLAAGARPLCNMCPVVAMRDGAPWFALGASGGRRIVSAVTQLTSMLVDFSMSLETAFATPRLEAAEEPILVDDAMPPDDLEMVLRLVPGRAVANTVYPSLFANPSAVLRSDAGTNSGMAPIRSPVAAAIMEGEIW